MTEDVRAILRRAAAAADSKIDLAETALALAALDRPRVALDWYRRHLTQLAAEVGEAEAAEPSDGVAGAAAALAEVLARRYGYRGDSQTYEDLQNANLMRVIDRRKGLPVALGILYIHAARAQGWEMVGLNFPGHFLVRLERFGERSILDPFHGGLVRQPSDLRDVLKAVVGGEAELLPEHYAPVGNRDILLRLQNNLKLRFLRNQQIDRAVEVVEGMLLIAPNEPVLWRESGLLQARLGNLAGAIEALERFLTAVPDDRLKHQTAVLLQHLKGRLH